MITTRKEFLPFALPLIGDEEINEVVDTLNSGWVTTGPKVKNFESQFSNYVSAKYSLAVNSCTAGLHVALRALNIKAGDEVILPTFTFCATANVVVHLGAKPVLVDVENDFNISVNKIIPALTPKTKAIMPVHYGGQSCDLKDIYQLAHEKNLAVVEDAAHAIGSTYQNEKVGSDTVFDKRGNTQIKRAVVFSFYATKNLTTGEGGMVCTNDVELGNRMRILSLHGMSKDAWKRYTSTGSWYYEVVEAGYKYNMTDIQAALGIHQLKRLDDFIKIRQKYADMYEAGFSDLPEIITPIRHSDRNHVYHLYPIQLNLDRLGINRAAFIEKLREYNIGSSVHFIPVHFHPFYQQTYGYKRGDLPNSENIYDRIISLPLYPKMTEKDVQYVIEVIRYLVKMNRR